MPIISLAGFSDGCLNGRWTFFEAPRVNGTGTYWNESQSHFMYFQTIARRWAISPSLGLNLVHAAQLGDTPEVAFHATDNHMQWFEYYHGMWRVCSGSFSVTPTPQATESKAQNETNISHRSQTRAALPQKETLTPASAPASNMSLAAESYQRELAPKRKRGDVSNSSTTSSTSSSSSSLSTTSTRQPTRFEQMQKKWDDYCQSRRHKGPLPITRDLEDVKIAYEVCVKQSYRAFKSSKDCGIFRVVPGDWVLNAGGNIGMFEYWLNDEMQGNFRSDVFEPSVGGTMQTLEQNMAAFHDKVTIHQVALGTKSGAEVFHDRTSATKGNSSRSCLASSDITYKNQSGVQQYIVNVVPFIEALLPHHTVVKLDIEGGEISILRGDALTFKCARLLLIEYSAARERKQFPRGTQPQDCVERFADVLDILHRAGVTHMKMPGEIYKENCWLDPDHRRHKYDFNMWAYREQHDRTGRSMSLTSDYLNNDAKKWLNFRRLLGR